MSDAIKNLEESPPVRGDLPFPWHCPKCRRKEVWPVTIPYRYQFCHDDRLHTLEVPQLRIPQCTHCGELSFSNDTEDQLLYAERIYLGLLTVEQIRTGREALGLSPEQLDALLGLVEGTVAAWEDNRRIQSRTEDRFLRAFFAVPSLRAALAQADHNPQFGATAVPDPAPAGEAAVVA